MEGIGWFSKEVLQRITRNHPEHEFLFLFDRKYDPSYLFSDNIKPIVLFPQARHPLLYYLFFEYSVPILCKKEKVDLFFSPDGYLSLRMKIPQLPVIHDLNFEHFPQFLPHRDTKYYRSFFPRFAKKAKRILTVSNYSKQDIATTYSIPNELIDVAFNGASEVYKPLNQKTIIRVREQYSKGCAYFLYVGSLNPRKNIVGLLKAFECFRSQSQSDIKMVIAGGVMWDQKDIDQQLKSMTFRDEVLFTGHLDQKELSLVTGSALVMTYISLFEGFGIPTLEAMKSGVPVITSNTTSLPEVVGNAGVLVNPDHPEEVAAAMESVAGSEEIRKRMIELGLKQAEKFTWDRCAESVWDSMAKILEIA